MPSRVDAVTTEPNAIRAILFLTAVLAVVVLVRLYYLFLTRDQPVWWDEGEYLIKARALALGTPDTGYFSGRPPLLSLVIAAVYVVGLGEATVRAGLALLSVASIYLTYRIGLRYSSRPGAVVAATLFSMFYLQLFYSTRVMTEIPHLALCLLGVELFLSRDRRQVLWSIPVLVLASLTRFPAALMVLILVLYDACSSRGATIRSRPFWTSGVLGALLCLPYLVWANRTYGSAFHALKASQYLQPALSFSDHLRGLAFYGKWMLASLGWILCGFAVVGAVRLFRRSEALGRVGIPARGVLTALWIAIPTAYFGLLVRPLLDRYLILVLPPLFILIGDAIVSTIAYLAPGPPALRWTVTVCCTLLLSHSLLRDADQRIRGRLHSYSALRDAGTWLKEDSESSAEVMSQSVAQVTYYSDRAGVPLATSLDATVTFLRESSAHYLVLSGYEPRPPWTERLQSPEYNLRTVAAFPLQRPEVVVIQAVRSATVE